MAGRRGRPRAGAAPRGGPARTAARRPGPGARDGRAGGRAQRIARAGARPAHGRGGRRRGRGARRVPADVRRGRRRLLLPARRRRGADRGRTGGAPPRPGRGTSEGRVGHRVGGGRDGDASWRASRGSDWLRPGCRRCPARPGPPTRRPTSPSPACCTCARPGPPATCSARPSRAAAGRRGSGQLPHLLFHLARSDATTDRWSRAEAPYARPSTSRGSSASYRAGGVVGRAGRGARPPGPGGGVPSPRRRGHEVGAGRAYGWRRRGPGSRWPSSTCPWGRWRRRWRASPRWLPCWGPAGRGSRPVAGARARRGVGAHG